MEFLLPRNGIFVATDARAKWRGPTEEDDDDLLLQSKRSMVAVDHVLGPFKHGLHLLAAEALVCTALTQCDRPWHD